MNSSAGIQNLSERQESLEIFSGFETAIKKNQSQIERLFNEAK
jgi:hypothetical protein